MIGDLHDGAGLIDATPPNGVVSNVIWENIDYDILTGIIIRTSFRLDLTLFQVTMSYMSQILHTSISMALGERYLTSNVQILGPATGKFEYIGQKCRYFTTKHGMKRSIEAILRS